MADDVVAVDAGWSEIPRVKVDSLLLSGVATTLAVTTLSSDDVRERR